MTCSEIFGDILGVSSARRNECIDQSLTHLAERIHLAGAADTSTKKAVNDEVNSLHALELATLYVHRWVIFVAEKI